MKTLRLLVAVGLITGSANAVLAQSNSVPTFKSEAEKAAWVKAHPELQPIQEIKPQDPNVRSNERFASDAEKAAWIDAQKEANPVQANTEKRVWAGQNHAGLKAAHTVKSTEKYATEAEKVAALKADKK
jgi:hypothetical protein